MNYKNIEIDLNSEKTFLHDDLGLTGCEISVNSMSIGAKVPFNHKHIQNEEVYIFLKGQGVMTLDNELVNIKVGSCVKVLPACSRTLENTGDEVLEFICVQAKENSLEQFGLKDAELC